MTRDTVTRATDSRPSDGCDAHAITARQVAGWWAMAEARDLTVGVCCCCGGPSPADGTTSLPYCRRCHNGPYEAQAAQARAA